MNDADKIFYDSKEVDRRSIKLSGIDYKDYPDFVDTYVSEAKFTDGVPLDEIQLEKFTEDNLELINDLVFETIQFD